MKPATNTGSTTLTLANTRDPAVAEAFRKNLLAKLADYDKVVVHFDAPLGYNAFVLRTVFGELISTEGQSKEFLDRHMELRPEDSSYRDYIYLAKEYMDRASKEAAAGS